MRFNRSRTFYRYLSSYLALLLVGVFALCLFFETYLSVQLKESIFDNHSEILRQSAQGMDDDIRRIEAIDYQLTSVNEGFLSDYLTEDSPVRDLKIVQELARMLAPLSFVSDIAMLDPDGHYVYTSGAAYAKEVFFSGIYHFDEWETVQEDLKNAKKRFVRPVESFNGVERYAVFVNTPSLYSRLGGSILLFFVRESRFASRFATEGGGVRRQGAAVSADGTVIFSTLPLQADALSGDRRVVTVQGERYLLLAEGSQVVDWTYYSLLPLSQVMLPVYRARTLSYALIFVTAVMGVILICYFMHVNYTPLKELTRALGAPEKGDELQSLSGAIHMLSAQNETLRQQLMSSPDGQALKDALLFSLLKGKFDSFERFNREGAPLGMTFDKPCYCVLMLRHFAPEEAEAPSRAQVQQALEKTLGSAFCWQFRELFEPSTAVCLVGMDEGAEDALAQACRAFIDLAQSEYNLSFTIGASGCYADISRITQACFEATQAVREVFVMGKHRYIGYALIWGKPPAPDLPPDALEGLDKRTPQERMQIMREFVRQIKQSGVPSLQARSYCNYALRQLLAAQDAGADDSALLSVEYLRTIDDFLALVLSMIEKSLQKTAPAPADAQDENALMTRIKGYISDHYDDCSFSIAEAAEHLGLNSSYMSQMFHRQTGDTLNGYVSALRMQKACSLLETTVMPLQMVAESVGYYNLNSFIRRFKQVAGVTPGEYRRNRQ